MRIQSDFCPCLAMWSSIGMKRTNLLDPDSYQVPETALVHFSEETTSLASSVISYYLTVRCIWFFNQMDNIKDCDKNILSTFLSQVLRLLQIPENFQEFVIALVCYCGMDGESRDSHLVYQQ